MLKFALIILALAAAPLMRGQNVDISTTMGPTIIDTAWRFHTGDDPAWAKPDFDDAHWAPMRLDRPWAVQGQKGYYGFAWYRIRIKLPEGKAPLGLAFREVCSADELYADGQLIGSIGQMRPRPLRRAYSYLTHAYPLPLGLNGKTVELAIRVWQPASSSTDYPYVGSTDNVRVGTVQAVALMQEISLDRFAINQAPVWVVDLVGACIAFFSICLFVLRRRSAEYLWSGMFLLCGAASAGLFWIDHIYLLPFGAYHTMDTGIRVAVYLFWLLFIWTFVQMPLDRLFFVAAGAVLLYPAWNEFVLENVLPVAQASLVWSLIDCLIGGLVFARLVRMALGKNRDAQLLLVPLVLYCGIAVLTNMQDALNRFGLTHEAVYRLGIPRGEISLVFYRGSGYTLTWDMLFQLLSYLSVGAVLVLRFTHVAERDERLSAEMNAAHRVQEQLVPTELPPTPKFGLQGAYIAAGEVGGDFYQVFPESGASVLVVIGDVSGKGLKAAMVGTLIVGALRSLAQESLGPGQVLARLNALLAGRTDGGFTTCCALHVAADGLLTVANAGHLAPYLDGSELTLENGLPLGLAAGAAYTESTFTFPPGAQLTLLTDGVVEARNASGELFGFARTAAIASEPAEKIAETAQAFGQEDDITVLTLTRLATAS